MLRIIGAQRTGDAATEFVLLQNQCSLKVHLKGHFLLTEVTLNSGDVSSSSHLFTDDVSVPAGAFVILSTGTGEPHWSRSKDGALLFCSYMNRSTAAWADGTTLHLLAPQHSFSERREMLLLV